MKLVRASFVLITAALPVALCGTLTISEARSPSLGLVVPKERTSPVDALRLDNLGAVRASDFADDRARLAVDGREDTAWSGDPGSKVWTWSALFMKAAHLGVLRAHWGNEPTSGVPTAFRWEVLPAAPGDAGDEGCDARRVAESAWMRLPDADAVLQAGVASTPGAAQPTRRSWFVDADACGLRLVVKATNGGPPVLREVQAIESARDVLREGEASDDGASPGFAAAGAIDGTYAGRWVGARGARHWTLRVDLREPVPIDRVRIVLGLDATSVARAPAGRSYAVAWAPVHYSLETSTDGVRFERIATEPVRADGSTLPVRRTVVTIAQPRPIRALRLAMTGATGADGRPRLDAAPVIREIAAYGADDTRPILAPPWILSVNANPSGQSRSTPGGELMDDARRAKFLQGRFASLLRPLQDDDLYARVREGRGESVDATSSDSAGEALESIEGDDPQLDATWIGGSSPPPIAVLGGSNDWDYAPETGPDARAPKRWHWDPLHDAELGGMGRLAQVVRGRMTPLLGFCGGAQLLGLLEARAAEHGTAAEDEDLIDQVLRRATGNPIRDFASPGETERAWPGDARDERATVAFDPSDPLFADLAGGSRRSTTQELPLSHADAIRPDAFLPGGPLRRFEVVATSKFCPGAGEPGPEGLGPASTGRGCRVVPQAFRSRDRAWPVIGAQFHAEQRDFSVAAPGDPPEAVADARLFVAAAYDLIVDASLRLAP